MRILYDGVIYKNQSVGGVNRYFNNLISRLPQEFTPTLTTCKRQRINYPVHPNLKKIFYQRFRPECISYQIEKYYFRAIERLHSFDLIHPTHYYLLTQLEMNQRREPIILTIYDMIYELFAKQMDSYDKSAIIKKQAILAAQKIICISENTKKDLLKQYALPEEKITVTYLAPDLDINSSYGSEPVPSRPYYLYVGGRTCYKNFDGLLSAFAKAISIRPDLLLCVVGSPFKETEKKLIADLKLIEHIKHYGNIYDSHLAKLYRCSIALVYPSLYEGFGIPPLEAMSCGTVVIAANAASIPEVVGDAGILFNPKAINELADILLLLLDSPVERDRLIKKGYQQTSLFNWDKTVAQTLEVYRSVI